MYNFHLLLPRGICIKDYFAKYLPFSSFSWSMSFPERKRHLTSIKNMCLNHFRKFNFLLKWFPELRSSPSFWSWIFTWSYVKSDLSDPTWASVNHMGFSLDPPPEKIHHPLHLLEEKSKNEQKAWTQLFDIKALIFWELVSYNCEVYKANSWKKAREYWILSSWAAQAHKHTKSVSSLYSGQ